MTIIYAIHNSFPCVRLVPVVEQLVVDMSADFAIYKYGLCKISPGTPKINSTLGTVPREFAAIENIAVICAFVGRSGCNKAVYFLASIN